MKFTYVQIRIVYLRVRIGGTVVTIRRGENSTVFGLQRIVWLVTIITVGMPGVTTVWTGTGQRTKSPQPFHRNSINTCTYMPTSVLWHRMGVPMANTLSPRTSSIILMHSAVSFQGKLLEFVLIYVHDFSKAERMPERKEPIKSKRNFEMSSAY